MRLALAILSPIFLLVCVVAIRSEETRRGCATRRSSGSSTLPGQREARGRRGAQGRRGEGTLAARYRRNLACQPEIAQIYLET